MAEMDLYPAVDVRGGKSVRLEQGDFARERVYGDPLERAREMLSGGAPWLHVVDLDGARSGVRVNRGVIESIASAANDAGASLQLGGGIRDESAVDDVLALGVTRVVMGTAAVEKPRLVERVARSHPGAVAVGLDYWRDRDTGAMEVATDGWEQRRGVMLDEVLGRFSDAGIGAVIVTDIGRDGTMTGPDVDGLTEVLSWTHVDVIASGGVSSLEDLGLLRSVEADGRRLAGVIVGKALYEGSFSVAQALGVCR